MRRTIFMIGVAAALLLTAPAAFAAGVPKAYLHVLPAAGHAGAKVQIRLGCEAVSTQDPTSPALRIGALHRVGPQNDPAKAPAAVATATVKPVAPGTYPVTFSCGGAELTTKFTVLGDAKQVSKVPSGAPRTGDGPDDPADAGLAMGVLAVGGGGLVLAKRAWRR